MFLAFFTFLLYFPLLWAQVSEEEVNYYDNLISSEMQKIKSYVKPTNAYKYKPTKPGTKSLGFFDFIIVGCGTTGSLLARRLTEIQRWNILVLETGTFGNDFTDIPAMLFANHRTDYNWDYQSVPQTTACLGLKNQSCTYGRGRGVGGTSLINGLLYVRGAKEDYDIWESKGNPGWSYENLLPYFKKTEHFIRGDPEENPEDPEYHGKEGLMNVEYHEPKTNHSRVFYEANAALGKDYIDYNGRSEFGYSPFQMMIKEGKRQDAGTVFIKPIRNKKNLKLLTEAYVTKVLINALNSAYGVEFTYKGQTHRAYSLKEIILSAGTFNTPQILMHSGVGPENHLKSLDIQVKKNLPVGSTLRDHPQIYGLTFSTNLSSPYKSQRELIREFLQGVGYFANTGGLEGVGFIQTSQEPIEHYADVEYIFISPNITSPLAKEVIGFNDETWEASYADINLSTSIALYIVALHAVSEGTVRLKSNDPFEYPVIDSKFLSDPQDRDINTLYEGLQFILKLMETEPFKKIDAKLQLKPLPACRDLEEGSKQYWFCVIRQLTHNIFHPTGSCPMGPNNNKNVVDYNLKVHGISNLRIADASVFPINLSGHPVAPCYAIAEKLGDLLKKQYTFFGF